MSTDLVVRRPEVPTAADMNAAALYAERLAASGLLPASYRRQPANVLYAIEYGRMIGLAPMAAITGVHVIEGKPAASAALISALVRRAGHKLRVRGDETSATAQIIRSDDPDYVFEATFTMRDAAKANLAGKAVWKQYPAAMLKSRAITQVCRDACEEVLFGLHYTAEELGAEVDEEGVPLPADTASAQTGPTAAEPIEDAELVDEQPPAPELATAAQLKALATLLGKKKGPMTDEVRLAGLSQFAGREITSSKQLTREEASRLIDWLGQQPDFVLTEEAVTEAAEALAQVAVPLAEHVEEKLRDAVESAGNPGALEAAMQTVFDAEAAGDIGAEALGRLQSAAINRKDQLAKLARAAMARRAEQKAQAAA